MLDVIRELILKFENNKETESSSDERSSEQEPVFLVTSELSESSFDHHFDLTSKGRILLGVHTAIKRLVVHLVVQKTFLKIFFFFKRVQGTSNLRLRIVFFAFCHSLLLFLVEDLFLLCHINVCVFKGSHLTVDSHIRQFLGNVLQESRHSGYFIEGKNIDHFLAVRVNRELNTCREVRIDHNFMNLSSHALELLPRDFFRFQEEIIANTETFLNSKRSIKSEKLAMRHNSDTI